MSTKTKTKIKIDRFSVTIFRGDKVIADYDEPLLSMAMEHINNPKQIVDEFCQSFKNETIFYIFVDEK